MFYELSMPNKTPIILQKISHLNVMCPHIIVWRHDLIMSLPLSAPTSKLSVQIATMVNKACIQMLNIPQNISSSHIPLLFVVKVACLLA